MATSLRGRTGGLGNAVTAFALVLAALVAVMAPQGRAAGAQENVETNATIRVVHASPGAPKVDFLIDGQPLAQGVSYGSATDYVPLSADKHKIQVVPTGQTADDAVIEQDLDADKGKAYIFIAEGPLKDIEGKVYEVDLDAIDQGKARARVIHASADAGKVDVAVTGGDTLFKGAEFGKATDYNDIDPGTLSLDIRGDGDRVLATVPDVTIQAGRVYDIIAYGQKSDQSVRVLPLVTNVSRPCADVLGLKGSPDDACVRIVHAVADGPSVDVYINDSPLAQGVGFGTATDYVNLPAGDKRKVRLTAAGSSADDSILDTDIDLKAGQAYQIIATGTKDDIKATVSEVDLAPVPEDQARLRVVHASPDAGKVDVGVADGPTIFKGVEFRDASDYAVVDAGAYTLQLHPAGEDTVTQKTDVELKAGTTYDVIALGRTDDGSLKLVVLESKASVREGSVATPGAATMTTPGAIGTVNPVGTPGPGANTDALEQSESSAETVVAGETVTPTPLP
jgi:hypothetical protein